jgi:hypothetical protein
MDEYIHRENLALYKKRLEEPHTDAEREILLKLLAGEKAKELPPEYDDGQNNKPVPGNHGCC